MKYKIWNKKDEIIEGVSVDYIIKSHNIRSGDGVFLVLDAYGNVTQIEIDRIIKSVYSLDANLTTEQVAQEYIRIKEDSNAQTDKDPVGVDELEKKIDILEAENNRLREVEKEQDKMIMDNTYKMAILETSIGGM